ncbi:hypothetical protein MY3296_009752 [Beauveria thailandica]
MHSKEKRLHLARNGEQSLRGDSTLI